MAKKTNETREKAKQIFLDSEGLAKPSEIAETLGVNPAQVRKWKCIDKWEEQLKSKPKKRGGQKGNKNAKGHGAPERNRNAETHGASKDGKGVWGWVNADSVQGKQAEAKPTTPDNAGGYKVKITADVLNVRKGPGTKYEVVTQVKQGEVYTIVGEEKNGSTVWGKLKSGAGYISLGYTKKV